jgi:hypothetical protein
MRGLGPRIPISDTQRLSDRDGRDKPGYDAAPKIVSLPLATALGVLGTFR